MSVQGKHLFVSIVVVSMLVMLGGCGGGGSSSPGFIIGGQDMVSLDLTSNGTSTIRTYEEAKTSKNPWGYDPYIYGTYDSSSVYIEVLDTYNAGFWDTDMLITMPTPTKTGTFNVLSSSVILLLDGDLNPYLADGVQGTVTFSKIDTSPGGKIVGSFNNVSLNYFGNSDPYTISGSFHVTVQ